MKLHYYPPNIFNGKTFYYYRCGLCGSLSISPLPDEQDLNLIYGENDYAYLGELNGNGRLQDDFDYPPHHYQKYQLEFLKEDIHLAPGKSLLEYGCGNGFYLAYSRTLGFETVGIEHDENLAGLLRENYGQPIYSFEEFEESYAGRVFDLIHFGHVLEHFSNPQQEVLKIIRYAHPATLFIFDGPVENNPCISRFVINMGSRIKRKKSNNYVPQHLSFTNYRSQLMFFEHMGFQTLSYKVAEQSWPLPQKPNWTSAGSTALFFLSRVSIVASRLCEKHGNIFHYAGTLKRWPR